MFLAVSLKGHTVVLTSRLISATAGETFVNSLQHKSVTKNDTCLYSAECWIRSSWRYLLTLMILWKMWCPTFFHLFSHITSHATAGSPVAAPVEQNKGQFLLKSPLCGRISGSLIWAPAHLQAQWCRHQGGDGNAGWAGSALCGSPQAGELRTSWHLSKKKQTTALLLLKCTGTCFVSSIPTQTRACHESKSSAFPWQLLQVVDKHFLVMDTGSSSKRHLKQ